MKERPINFSTDMIKAILNGRKTMTRRVITPQTSIVGEGRVDWSKFCWDGNQVYKDTCHHGHTELHGAPLPFVDGHANEYYPYEHQYLHVPYNWEEDMTIFRIYPKWEAGDRLWVRETWRAEPQYDSLPPKDIPHTAKIDYSAYSSKEEDKATVTATPLYLAIASTEKIYGRTRPALHIPRWASRLLLEITGIRVERLQDITEDDAKAEGIKLKFIGGTLTLEHQDYYKYVPTFRELWDSLNAKRGYGWTSNPFVWCISFRRVE